MHWHRVCFEGPGAGFLCLALRAVLQARGSSREGLESHVSKATVEVLGNGLEGSKESGGLLEGAVEVISG